MESLAKRTEKLLLLINGQHNPEICGSLLETYIAHTMRDKQITLYEAYLLNAEALALLRASYIQPAWNRNVSISTLVRILNMKLMSNLYQDKAGADLWMMWGVEAHLKNIDKRPHYILDEYLSFLSASENEAYLKKLLDMREGKQKPSKKGPYHDEFYPFDHCSYEELMLVGQKLSKENKLICGAVENLLVQLSLMQEE